MSNPRFRVSLLAKQDRSGFACHVAPLDRYFHTQVSQDIRRRLSACYIMEERATDQIAGFYTLSAADIPVADAPEDMVRKLPRYPTIPAARLGRLAVDHRFQGQKLGSALLASAVTRAAQSEIAVFAMIVDAKDDSAAAFYRHHGFMAYGSAPLQMIAPIKTLIGP